MPAPRPRATEGRASPPKLQRRTALDKRISKRVQIVLVEFLNRTYPNTRSDRGASCDRPETRDSILLPIGMGARDAWLHDDCWAPWRNGGRTKAIAMLAEAMITEPPPP